MTPVTTAALEALRAFDTTTLLNALERLVPERQGHGFTRAPLVCVHPALPPIVGHARTARIRAAAPSGRTRVDDREAELAAYRHVGAASGPKIVVIEDVDEPPGIGAWWGEVNTHLYRGLGAQGVVTNGIVRDLDQVAEGFQVLAGAVGPSHAHVHVVDVGGPVTVAGMAVRDGDLIHADRHGAMVVPEDQVTALPAAARQVIAEERALIEASLEPGFDFDVLERLARGEGRH